METKKNRDKNVENLRIPLVFSGLLFTGGLLLASFTYSTPVGEEVKGELAQGENKVQYVQEANKSDQPEPPQNEQTYIAPPQQTIVRDSNIVTPPVTTVTTITPPIITISTTTTVTAEPIEDWPDVDAEFPGGYAEMQRWIGNNIIYPEISIQMEEQGKVYLSFVVEKDGSITGIEIEKSVSRDLDREAKRVVRDMPKWKPGESNGRNVRTRCRLPIVFTLQ